MQSHSQTSSNAVSIIAYAFANDANISLETENITFLLIIYSSLLILSTTTSTDWYCQISARHCYK